MVIKDKFRFTSFILFVIMFFTIIFLSIKAYGSNEYSSYKEDSISFGDYISESAISLDKNTETDAISEGYDQESEEIFVNYKQVRIFEGESLWNIAKRYHTKGDIRKYVRQLATINNITETTFSEDRMLMIPITK